MKKKTKPPAYRLTLSMDAFNAARSKLRLQYFVLRRDNRIDVPISMSLLDQLQTAALPKENLSDTVLRIMAPKP